MLDFKMMAFEINNSTPFPVKGNVDSVTASLRELRKGESILIAYHKNLNRNSIYTLAKRAEIKVTSKKEKDGLRVWRTDGTERPKRIEIIPLVKPTELPADEMSMGVENIKQAKLAKLRMQMSGEIPLEIPEPPLLEIDQWVGYTDIQKKYDDATGEHVAFRQHIKTGKIKELSRSSFE